MFGSYLGRVLTSCYVNISALKKVSYVYIPITWTPKAVLLSNGSLSYMFSYILNTADLFHFTVYVAMDVRPSCWYL